MSFPLERYLARIGLASPPPATEEGLRAVHEAQARAFAFENLDVLSGKGVSLDPADIEDKLLGEGRGGYCFELNGLLLRAMRALGFEARPLLARVLARWDPSTPPPARTHQVSLVTLEGRPWIADVGFGGGLPLHPMPLEAERESLHLGETLRYVEHELGWMLQLRQGDGWRPLYVVDLATVFPSDIATANHWTSTHPSSPFTRFPFVTRVVGDERRVLFGGRLTVNGEPRGEAPEGEALRALLAERFGVEATLDPLGERAG